MNEDWWNDSLTLVKKNNDAKLNKEINFIAHCLSLAAVGEL